MRVPINEASEVENRNRVQERTMSVGFGYTPEMLGWAEIGRPRCSLSRRRAFQCKLLIISAIISPHGTHLRDVPLFRQLDAGLRRAYRYRTEPWQALFHTLG